MSSEAPEAVTLDGRRPRAAALRRVLRRLSDSPEIGIIVALIVVFTIFTLKNPLFASRSDLQNPLGIDLAGFGILAIGESFAIITGGIDLSVGSLTAFFVVFSAWLNVTHHMPAGVAFALTLLLGAVWGLWHGLLITRLGVAPFVATLVTFIFATGADEAIAPSPIPISSQTFLDVAGRRRSWRADRGAHLHRRGDRRLDLPRAHLHRPAGLRRRREPRGRAPRRHPRRSTDRARVRRQRDLCSHRRHHRGVPR